jgi:hypothetical protein
MFFIGEHQYKYILHKMYVFEEQISYLQDKEKSFLSREKNLLERIRDLEDSNSILMIRPRCFNDSFTVNSVSIKAVVEKILDHLNLSLEYVEPTKESVQLKKGEKKNVK